MVFYFELVELSMNLRNIVDKVDKEDKLVENWTQGRGIPIDSVKSSNYFGNQGTCSSSLVQHRRPSILKMSMREFEQQSKNLMDSRFYYNFQNKSSSF